MSEQDTPKTRRTWHYFQQPPSFGIAGCPCGNEDTQWSEFEKHLWCPQCQTDFIPAHSGVFDGPIGVYTANALGIHFDRVNLLTGKLERFNLTTLDYSEAEAVPTIEGLY